MSPFKPFLALETNTEVQRRCQAGFDAVVGKVVGNDCLSMFGFATRCFPGVIETTRDCVEHMEVTKPVCANPVMGRVP